MQIKPDQIEITCTEPEIFNHRLSLDHKHILELGCGNAEITRHIATSGSSRKVTALEVDEIAHRKNLQIEDLPNVSFGLSGAQKIPLHDKSVDIVFMFKSLHHVPVELMEAAMLEIRRVLKPGGFAYISEPIFSGDFNAILSLFHDEENVRQAAFDTLRKVVNNGLFNLVEEIFFNVPKIFENFAEFEAGTINATHSNHALDSDLHALVKRRFEAHAGDSGAHFLIPIRVDLLQRPLGHNSQ